MADNQFINILSKGVDYWNEWRKNNPGIQPDFSGAVVPGDLLFKKGYSPFGNLPLQKWSPDYEMIKENLVNKVIDFSNTNFVNAKLEQGIFVNANFEGSNFYEADLSRAILFNANLSNCNFRKAYMAGADLSHSKIICSNLNRVNITHSKLLGTRIENCIVYGASAWGLFTNDATVQKNLMIEDTNAAGEDIIAEVESINGHYPFMVDDIEIAQFINFITNYKNLGKSLNAMLEKGVLLLGKFRDGGREILELIAEELRKQQLIPIIFDFEKPQGSNLIETVTVLAGISRFVVANLNGSSVPAELTRVTANFKRPIITYCNSQEEDQVFAMFSDLLELDNILYFKYSSNDELASKLRKRLVEAEENLLDSQQQALSRVQRKRRDA